MSEPLDEMLPAVPDVQILRLQPGDTVVFTAQHHLSDDEYDRIGAQLKERFPDNPKIVLDGGAALSVLRQQAGEQS